MHGNGGGCGSGQHAWWGTCMAGGACVVGGLHGRGVHATPTCQIPRDTVNSVNERPVGIILECILVYTCTLFTLHLMSKSKGVSGLTHF